MKSIVGPWQGTESVDVIVDLIQLGDDGLAIGDFFLGPLPLE